MPWGDDDLPVVNEPRIATDVIVVEDTACT
jgi:hypothetical protein